ncbi:MAG: hypothetical protein K9K62_00185 [Desulfobacteraceae bacterium]|nr:hypothetical protein [Desulfobacteraceae bacterium]
MFLHRGSIYRVDGSTVVPVADVGQMAYLDNHVGILAAICGIPADPNLADAGLGASVRVQKIDSGGGLTPFHHIFLPEGQAVGSAAISKNLLFVTGHLGEHVLGFFDLNDSRPQFNPVEVPDKVKDKAFDELVIDGDILLAIDDLIMPKWLVVYDLSDPAKPATSGVFELMEGINASVDRAVAGPDHLALLCKGFHQAGAYQSVQIYDKNDAFRPLDEIELWQGSLDNLKGPDIEISFDNSRLLIAGYKSGVGVLECARRAAKELQKPKMLWLTDDDGNPVFVRDAVCLPFSESIAVWTDEKSGPFIVNRQKLAARSS